LMSPKRALSHKNHLLKNRAVPQRFQFSTE
jgi:hypothetical protein